MAPNGPLMRVRPPNGPPAHEPQPHDRRRRQLNGPFAKAGRKWRKCVTMVCDAMVPCAPADFYGKGMLAAGVTAQMITAWSADPNVLYQGTNGSIFDKLEDLNSDVCLAKAADIAKSL